jgi:hypothetical protein
VLPQTTTTILHDWIKGRHSEVAHRIERGELKPDPANLALLYELLAADLAPSPRLATTR